MFRSKNQSCRNIIAAFVLVLGLMMPTTKPLAKSGGNPKTSPPMQTVHRPLSDFLSAQGTVSVFNCCAPMVPDYIGWTRPFSTPAADQRLALVDYAGVGNNWLVANGYPSLGTTISGNITERPLADGRAEVTVNLHTRNALAYALTFDLAGPINQNQLNPLLFGFKPQDLLADPTKQPALGQSHLHVVFKNPAPGTSLPDIVNAFVLGNTVPGQELVSIYFNATATGELRAASGFPEGASGRLTIVQSGILFRGSFKGGTADGFPAEIVELRRVGQ
ncbi:MAG: hypothetical protein ACRD82_14485 [Blastocatellia bacterium]